MTSAPILIGGTAGATGSMATKLLLQMGFPVRAIVRGQRVDGVIIWDWVCDCARRPCPKLGGDQAARRTAIGP
jgi:hypothetical protein